MSNIGINKEYSIELKYQYDPAPNTNPFIIFLQRHQMQEMPFWKCRDSGKSQKAVCSLHPNMVAVFFSCQF